MDGPGGNVHMSEAVVISAADNSRKSRIPISAAFVTVADDTTDANDWILLPTGVPNGHKIRGWSVVAHEIRTEPLSNVKINDVDGDSTETAVAATTLWEATYVNSTQGWIIVAWTELGAALTLVTN
jgi:hypothetical protein